MPVLVLGSASDAHTAHIHRSLSNSGAEVYYWDAHHFPTQMQLSWQPQSGEGSIGLPTGQRLYLSEIQSIYWRQLSDVFVPDWGDVCQHHIAVNDSMGLMRTWLQVDSIRWINSWKAFQFHKEKPLQLATVNHQGIKIPATLVSNCPIQIQHFAERYKKLIFKPVYGGAHTKIVTDEHLQSDRLSKVLKLSPVTIQEYIPGTNIRSYVIGKIVYSAEICADSLDFRADPSAELIAHSLPESVYQQCLAIACSLFLEWTAIDWRLTPDGQYIFLEANPSPMFIHFEQVTGFPITQQLVNLLTN